MVSGLAAVLTSALLGAQLAAVQAGPVRLRFVSADTAQVFRVVDQLSGWSATGPRRFRQSTPKLSDEQRKLLERHAEVRNRVGWQVTHTAFVVELPIDDACKAAVASRLLSAADAELERQVLHAFESWVREWVKSRAGQLDAAVANFQTEPELARFAREAARFSASKLSLVEVFLVPSSEGADGAYTSGKIVLEVPPDGTDDPLLHELWHAFAGTHRAAFQRVVQGKARLDVETLSEGIAYAVQPGLFPPPRGRGAIELTVGAALRGRKPYELAGPTRPLELAVALRPVLERAWATSTLEAFLPTAAAIYDALMALDAASLATPGYLLFYGDSIAHRLPIYVETRRLDPELFKYATSPSPVVGFSLVGRGPESIPAAFREKFFSTWADVEAIADAGSGTFESIETVPAVFVWWDRGTPQTMDGGLVPEDPKVVGARVAVRIRESIFRLVAAGGARPMLEDGGPAPEARDGG